MSVSNDQVKISDIEVESRPLGHLGLISAFFEEFGLKDFFDTLLPKTREHKVSHGTAILAFLLNGLSFARRQLYLFPEFFRNLPLNRLLGDGVEPEHLNDSVMGELLDKIYSVGPTELFQKLVSHVLRCEQLDLSLLHADTTNFSVHGDYEVPPVLLSEDQAPQKPVVEVTLGHPKDGRWDLKRFVLSLLVNTDGIPLFMKTHSGNASDHQTIKEAMESVQSSMRETLSEGCSYFVADAAFYTSKNIKDFCGLWVSRVPATLEEAHRLLHSDAELKVSEEDERYSFYETSSEYAGVRQKWVLVRSAEMQAKMELTFAKTLEKERVACNKGLVHLKNKEFACASDALAYASEWGKKYPMFELVNLSTVTAKRRASGLKGRPKKDEILNEVTFLEAELQEKTEVVELERSRLGRFILASNDTELHGDELLKIYKSQMHVERGFRFLKNKSFLVSETYLKKPERIESLSFIMVLCLLVYSLLELKLRRGLAEENQTIPNSLGKATATPTLQWAFSFFTGIAEARLLVADVVKNVTLTRPHDTPTVNRILDALGERYKKFYRWD